MVSVESATRPPKIARPRSIHRKATRMRQMTMTLSTAGIASMMDLQTATARPAVFSMCYGRGAGGWSSTGGIH
jgi:hypothetical protein